MQKAQIIKFLTEKLQFSNESIKKLIDFENLVLNFNKKYNLISKSTEKTLFYRHILDSAQLVKYINFEKEAVLADLGSGGGFPGIILAIFNKNANFHVKLFEKSPVKRMFLNEVRSKLDVKVQILSDYRVNDISSNYIVSRAFKKLPILLDISREKNKKPHKLIILKGKSAQEEINKASQTNLFKYRIENSITDKESRILIFNIEKK